MQGIIKFLTGKRTIIVTLCGGILAMLPEWAASLPEGVGMFDAVISLAQKFWVPVATIFGALKVNNLINSNGGTGGG